MAQLQTLSEFLGTDKPVDAPDALQDVSVKDFCKGVLQSREYRQSVLNRITLGILPPAVECRMYDYAYGKPAEHIEVTDNRNPFQGMSADAIVEHLRKLEDVARQLTPPPQELVH